MKTVYNLTITDLELSYNNHCEIFNIGYFTAYEKAFETANRYLKEVEGFNKYPCRYDITEKPISDFYNQMSTDEIFIVCGWNINDSFEETDIIESDCFILYETALQKLYNMKQKYFRTEWCIDRYKLNECIWVDGFIKI